MRSATLMSAGSWALALLLGFFLWLSPDTGFYPSPAVAAVVIGLAFVIWIAGSILSGFPRSAPRLSVRAQLGALAPMLAATLALMLTGRGLLPHPLLPLLFILAGGIGGWWWAQRVEGAPSSRGQEMGLAFLLVPMILIVGPAFLLAVLGQELWMISASNYATMVDRIESVDAFVPYRPAPRPGISAETAGIALVAIANTGETRVDSHFVATPSSTSRPWLADSGPFARRSGDSVMMKALGGLTREERAWLEVAGRHPGLPLLDTVAYASHLDPWAALRLPVPATMNAMTLPVPSVIAIRGAARLQLYRAALAAADRKPAVADSLIRSVIGFGLRLRDDADQLIVAIVGAAIAREGAATLAALRNGAGHTPAGDSLALLSAPRPAVTASRDLAEARPTEIRDEMLMHLGGGTVPRPVQWDLAGILGISRCTNLRELFYGPSPKLQAAYATMGAQVEPSAQAQAAFQVVQRGVTLDPSGSTPAFLRLTELAIGREVAGACIAVVTLM